MSLGNFEVKGEDGKEDQEGRLVMFIACATNVFLAVVTNHFIV